MTFTDQQKLLIKEALRVYAQITKSRVREEQYVTILSDVKQIYDQLEVELNQIEKLVGINDEQFEKVCKICDKFKNKCTDPIAIKFPGKCDPILHFEKNKETNNGTTK